MWERYFGIVSLFCQQVASLCCLLIICEMSEEHVSSLKIALVSITMLVSKALIRRRDCRSVPSRAQSTVCLS